LEIPPLRDRTDDLLAIAEHLLHQHHPESRFTPDAITAMLSYRWPGNVRELKNAVFHAVMCARNPQTEITASDLKLLDGISTNGHAPLNGDLNQVERQMIFQALDKFGGNQGKAAQSLGISRRTLIRKLKMYRKDHLETASGVPASAQERHYRAVMRLPVKMQYADEQLEATLLNLSIGGAAVAVPKTLDFGMPASIYLVLPETDEEVEVSGRVAWTNSEAQYGIQFCDLPANVLTSLRSYLLKTASLVRKPPASAERPLSLLAGLSKGQ